MVDVRLDIRELSDFQASLKGLPYAIDQKVTEMTLKKAVQPLYRYMKSIAPVSKGGRERVSLSKNRGRSNDYRRGGATKADVRVKTVTDTLGQAKVLVGVSKGYGKVGWRYHFIAQGVAGQYRAKAGPRPFVERAGNVMGAAVEADFRASFGGMVQRVFEKYKIAA